MSYEVFKTGLFSTKDFNVLSCANTMRTMKTITFTGIDDTRLVNEVVIRPTYMSRTEYDICIFRDVKNEVSIGVRHYIKGNFTEQNMKSKARRWISRAIRSLESIYSDSKTGFYIAPSDWVSFVKVTYPFETFINGLRLNMLPYEGVDILDRSKSWLKELCIEDFKETEMKLIDGESRKEELDDIASEAVRLLANSAKEKIRLFGRIAPIEMWFGQIRVQVIHAAADSSITKKHFTSTLYRIFSTRSTDEVLKVSLADTAYSVVEDLRAIKLICPKFNYYSIVGENFELEFKF